jgi:hypothetical protein
MNVENLHSQESDIPWFGFIVVGGCTYTGIHRVVLRSGQQRTANGVALRALKSTTGRRDGRGYVMRKCSDIGRHGVMMMRMMWF